MQDSFPYRTAATRDRNSPLMVSPRVPRIHNIQIRHESESALVPVTKPRRQMSTESQEMCLDISAELSRDSSFDGHNNSAEVEAILTGHPRNGRFATKPPSSIRSCDDRSLDEMSIHDQLLRRNDLHDGQLEAYRQRLVSDIQVRPSGAFVYIITHEVY